MNACPRCKATGLRRVHVHRLGWISIACDICDGAGCITDEVLERVDRGARIRYHRVEVLQMAIRERAKELGIGAGTLSDIEAGRIENKQWEVQK